MILIGGTQVWMRWLLDPLHGWLHLQLCPCSDQPQLIVICQIFVNGNGVSNFQSCQMSVLLDLQTEGHLRKCGYLVYHEDTQRDPFPWERNKIDDSNSKLSPGSGLNSKGWYWDELFVWSQLTKQVGKGSGCEGPLSAFVKEDIGLTVNLTSVDCGNSCLEKADEPTKSGNNSWVC